jgi:hypothetical protein
VGAPAVEDAARGGEGALLGLLASMQPRCGFLIEIKLAPTVLEAGDLPLHPAYIGVPPSPPPSESLAGRGFCKNSVQNLDIKELRDQNLDNKRFRTSDAISAHRHGLDHDCASGGRWTRLDVTMGCGFPPRPTSRKGAEKWGTRHTNKWMPPASVAGHHELCFLLRARPGLVARNVAGG